VIEFRGFGKRFGAVPAVRAMSLEIGPGEAVALLGPNGSGKTTSLKAAAGLLRPTEGEVLLGRPGRPASDPAARRVLSFLPQRVAFPEALTGHETLEFHRSLRDAPPARVEEMLRFAGLNGAGGRPVATYSGGMTQRLGLAVALLPDAPVLLLDEPTAALDPEGLCALAGVVGRHRAEGKTILFTSHQLGDVERMADRTVVLVGGRVVADLSARELADRLADRGVLRVRVHPPGPRVLDAVRAILPRVAWDGDELRGAGPARMRPAVLDAVRACGAEVLSITTEEGRLDGLYLELVGEAT
jgi:ABC-type multidrug transport system ATPase subunit